MLIRKGLYKKPIFVIVACLIFSGLIFTTAFALHRNSTTQTSTANEESPSTKSEAIQQENTETKNEEVNSAKEDTTTSNTPPATQSTNNTQDNTPSTYVAPATSTPQPATQTPVTSCNESMKASYTNLYNSKITAENTRWSNQVNGFANYASGNGMSFSGYVQEQTALARPTHDANIASIKSEYQSNLASINCN